MASNGYKVEVTALPDCDFHLQNGSRVTAVVDGATRFGPWANMCEMCFKVYGVGLGVGKGQALILAAPAV